MTRIEMFQQTLDGCRKLEQEFPGNPLLKSAQTQMQYLIDIEQGKRQDRERLNDINIGLIAVREIEGVDDNLANWIYERVCPAVEEMKQEAGAGAPPVPTGSSAQIAGELNPAREFMTDAARPLPAQSVLLELTPDGTRKPIKKF